MNKRLNKTKKTAIIAACFLFLSSSILVYFALKQIKIDVLNDFSKSLNAVMETNSNALSIWIEQQTTVVATLSTNENIIAFLAQKQNVDSLAFRNFDGYISTLKEIQDLQTLAIYDQDEVEIYRSDAPAESVNLVSLIRSHYPQLFSMAKTAPIFIPPIRLSDEDLFVYAFFVSPIQKDEEHVGWLISAVSPFYRLSDITQLGRIGDSGETYLFDRDAYMLTRSRFREDLINLEMLKNHEFAVLTIKLYDPKVNIYESPKAQWQTEELTQMAQSALKGERSSNLAGYRDYRGVMVVGAWQWLPELQMGITTEIDLNEALLSYHQSRNVFIVLWLLCLLITVILGWVLVIIADRASRQLQKAANNLERKVSQRTDELRNALNKLNIEQAITQALFDNIPDPIFCKDHALRYIKGNQAFFKIFNKLPEQVIGYTDEEITELKDVEFFRSTDMQVLLSGETIVFERETNLDNKSERIFETRKFKVTFNNHEAPGILGLARDITEQRQNEIYLREATKAAQAASKAKSEFLARMSHEIRTPMNGVIGMLDLLIDSDLSSHQRQQVEIARSSADSLLGILNDILDFSRIEAGKLALDEVEFDVVSLIEDTAKAIAIRAEAKGIELLVDITRIDNAFVKGDPLRLRQILTNLLNNAIKFTHEGQVVVKAQFIEKNKRPFLECHVEDSGIGIHENKLESIFDSFSQIDSSTTRVYGGSGLGLAICKRLCNLMNGDISAQSVFGKGSTFTFTVELEHSQNVSVSPLQSVLPDTSVLVVDDNLVNLEIIKNQLAKAKAKVQLCTSVDDALHILSQSADSIDLVLTDMSMPEKNGLILAQAIKNQTSTQHIKVIMLSSMSFSLNRDELKAKGLHASLLKPVSSNDLLNTIALVMNGDENSKLINDQNLLQYRSVAQQRFATPDYHKVLIVEDNPVNMMVAEGLLQKLNLHFDKAFNGQECLEKLQSDDPKAPYTLILMDCQMPVMDGYQTTKQIRNAQAGDKYTHIPIIAMTANVLKGDREKCISYGMNGYVAKPIILNSLLKELNEGFALCPKHLLGFKMPEDYHYQQKMHETLNIKGLDLRTMDWEDSAPSLQHSPELYLNSLQVFCKQYKDKHFNLASDLASIVNLSTELHALKGASGNLGFKTLYEECQRLEVVIESQKLYSSDLNTLNAVLNDAIIDAESIIDNNSMASTVLPRVREITPILDDIYEYTKNSEFVPLELLWELKAHLNQLDKDDEIHQIIDLLEQFDYDKINAIIAGRK